MANENFISPTMQWLYDRNPDWTADREMLYRMGFSKNTMVDVHGFDIRGFNDQGIDRLGCTVEDYGDPEIMEIARMSGQAMSLSNKLVVPLPRFIKLKKVFEHVCRQRWDVEPVWEMGAQQWTDGKKRLHVHLASDLFFGIQWFDRENDRNTYMAVRTDVIARIFSATEENFQFRLFSSSEGSGGETVEQVVDTPNVSEVMDILQSHIDMYMQPLVAWNVMIVDTSEGPVLAAYSPAEIVNAEGDRLGEPVRARTREDALRSVMENARSGSVARMASAGIQALATQPAVFIPPGP